MGIGDFNIIVPKKINDGLMKYGWWISNSMNMDGWIDEVDVAEFDP